MSLLACITSLFVLLLATAASANTEKTIFIAPAAVNIPESGPGFGDLHLSSLSPQLSSLRASLPVSFPTTKRPHGIDSWYLLRNLNNDQRYEARVCWAAIQPTTFWLDVFNTSHVFDTPELIQSLAAFAEQQQATSSQDKTHRSQPESGTQERILFLRVQAAADFFTSNATLMQHPPPVDVDIILDPYLGNVLPRSLVPTAGYIVVLAVGSWLVSGAIWKRLFSDSKPHQD